MSFQSSLYSGHREADESLLLSQLRHLSEDETNRVALLANASALLNSYLNDVNWVGFYLLDNTGSELILGPFQGLPACVRIPLGKGVCGTSAQQEKTIRVENVHQFPGHIACDSASNSEIVIPLYADNTLLGVLDIDSPSLARFSEEDQSFLEEFVRTLSAYL